LLGAESESARSGLRTAAEGVRTLVEPGARTHSSHAERQLARSTWGRCRRVSRRIRFGMHEDSIETSAFLDGADAAKELGEALALAGFRLPFLRGDLPVLDRAHVQLGGASAAVVRELAGWIRSRA
jgi:hypothetical protein